MDSSISHKTLTDGETLPNESRSSVFDSIMEMISHVPFTADTPTADLCLLLPAFSNPVYPPLHAQNSSQSDFETVAPFLQSVQLKPIKWRTTEDMAGQAISTSTARGIITDRLVFDNQAHTNSSAIAAEPPHLSAAQQLAILNDSTLSLCARLDERDGVDYTTYTSCVNKTDCNQILSKWTAPLAVTTLPVLSSNNSLPPLPTTNLHPGPISENQSSNNLLPEKSDRAKTLIHPAPDTDESLRDQKRVRVSQLIDVPDASESSLSSFQEMGVPTEPILLDSEKCDLSFKVSINATSDNKNSTLDTPSSKKTLSSYSTETDKSPSIEFHNPLEIVSRLILNTIWMDTHRSMDTINTAVTDFDAAQYAKISRYLSKLLPRSIAALLKRLDSGENNERGVDTLAQFIDISHRSILFSSHASLFASSGHTSICVDAMSQFDTNSAFSWDVALAQSGDVDMLESTVLSFMHHIHSTLSAASIVLQVFSSELAHQNIVSVDGLISNRETQSRFCREELLVSCIDVLKSQLSNTIVQAISLILSAEDRPSDKKIQQRRILLLTSAKDIFLQISLKISECFELLCIIGTSTIMNREAILSLVYSLIPPFFIEASAFDGEIGFDHILVQSTRLLSLIFYKYPHHRQVILEEIMSHFSKICTTTKKNHRSFRLVDGKLINVVTSLLMNLLQSCGSMLNLSTDYSELLSADSQIDGAAACSVQFANTTKMTDLALHQIYQVVHSSNAYITFIIKYLLSRCVVSADDKEFSKQETRKRVGSLESEYCTVFDMFLRDLLSVVGSPEWPIAEVLAHRTTSIIIQMFDDSFKYADSVVLRVIGLDWLENFGAFTAGLLTQWNRFKTESGLSAIPSMNPSAEDIPRLFQLQGDLLKWQSSSCLQDSMAIDSLVKYTISKWVTAASTPTFSFPKLDSINAFSKQIFVSHFAHLTATSYTLNNSAVLSTRNNAEFLSSHLMITQNKFDVRDAILHCICSCLKLDSVILRTRSLKALHEILKRDSSLLLAANIHNVIRDRLMDSSANVRDAAIDLLGSYVFVAGSDSLKLYYPVLCDRVMDVSPAVRKRILRLFKNIYQTTLHSVSGDLTIEQKEIVVDIALRIIGRLHDEESVADLASKILCEFWLQTAQGCDLSTISDWQSLPEQSKHHLQKKCIVFSSVVSKSSAYSLLVGELLKSTVKSTSEKPQAMTQLRSHMNGLILCLMDQLLLYYEKSQINNISFNLALLLRLSDVVPDLVSPHLFTLYPFLKPSKSTVPAEIQQELAITHHVLSIFMNVLPMVKNVDLALVESIETDLLQLLNKSSQNILQAAVPCLCIIVSKHTRNVSKIVRVVTTCYSLLEKSKTQYLTSKTLPPTSVRSIWRCMILLSQIMQHYDFSSHHTDSKYIIPEIEMIAKGLPVICAVYDLIMFFIVQVNSADTNLVALSCLGSLYLAHSTLLMNEQTVAVFTRVFSGKATKEKRQLLMILNEYFEREKSAGLTDSALVLDSVDNATQKTQELKSQVPTKIDMKILVGSADEFAEAGVASSVAQRFLGNIIDCLVCGDVQLQTLAFQTLALIVEQGFVHPILVVPAIAAIASSDYSVLASNALSMHQKLANKHASFIHSKNMSAVRCIYEFHALQSCKDAEYTRGYVYKPTSTETDVALHAFARIGNLYALVQPVRIKRNEFLRAIVRVFEGSKSDMSIEHVRYQIFISENLAHLDFKTFDEVLLVIHCITRILSISGESTMDTVRKVLSDSKDISTKGLKVLMYRALGVGIMTLTKHHLQQRYQLSESRCSMYIPTATASKSLEKQIVDSMMSTPINWELLLIKPIAELGCSDQDELFQQCIKVNSVISTLGNAASEQTCDNILKSKNASYECAHSIKMSQDSEPHDASGELSILASPNSKSLIASTLKDHQNPAQNNINVATALIDTPVVEVDELLESGSSTQLLHRQAHVGLKQRKSGFTHTDLDKKSNAFPIPCKSYYQPPSKNASAKTGSHKDISNAKKRQRMIGS
ncbi:Sister chromatid cohesion protein 2 [Batrachochytrium dendrobatidis]|nr:Sister chromatid cohesion protein 2 [Batrachochytrium dendrobatidis]